MHRKQFIKKMLQAGLCGCGAIMGFSRSLRNEGENSTAQDRTPAEQSWIKMLEKRMMKGSETPAWRRVEKSESWIKDLMDNIDAVFDEETKIKLMQNCGRACFTRAFGVASEEKSTPEEAGKVCYQYAESSEEVERMDYLEFIAGVTSHIPEKDQVMIRYYGLYANAHRGKLNKTGVLLFH